MKNHYKSKLHSIVIGLKIGWHTTTLPEKVQSFHNSPLCRIFRVVGGICLLIVVTRHNPMFFSILSHLPLSVAILVVTLAILHLCYILGILIFRLKHIHSLFKNNKLEVRNSSLDRLATLSLKLLMCAKYGCLGVAGAGTAITTFTGLDTILELGGHEPIFLQGVADIGNSILGIDNARTEYLKQKKILSNITTVNQRFLELKDSAKEINGMVKNSGIFTQEELEELLTELSKEAYVHRNQGIKLSNDLQSSISKSEILRELKNRK